MTTEHPPERVTLLNVQPRVAIEGGRIAIACRNMDMGAFASASLKVGGVATRLDFARADLLLARKILLAPEKIESRCVYAPQHKAV